MSNKRSDYLFANYEAKLKAINKLIMEWEDKLPTHFFFITLVLFATYSERVKEAEAIVTPLVNICHCEQPDGEDFYQCQTLHISIPAALAHLTQHDSDHPGACLADVCDNLEGVQEDTPSKL